jgi:hypothetical protein
MLRKLRGMFAIAIWGRAQSGYFWQGIGSARNPILFL